MSIRTTDFWLTVTRAMLATLDLDQLLYILLSGSTAGDGLNFNRAFLFLVDDDRRSLKGRLAIGPMSQEEAYRIWEEMEERRFDLPQLMARYATFRADPDASEISKIATGISLPLPLQGSSKFEHLMRRALSQQSVLSNNTPVPLLDTEIALYNTAMVSLVLEGKTIGVLVVDNAFNRRMISMNELNTLTTVANLTAIAVERAQLHSRIRQLAETDSLTGILNRHAFDQQADELFQASLEKGEPLSLMMVDIDFFKQCNDTHGHLVGDEILRSLGRLLRTLFDRSALIARFGGDEMVLLLPGADEKSGCLMAERLREQFGRLQFGGDPSIQTSLTIGVCERAEQHKVFTALLADADQVMYEAKAQGRNCVRSLGNLTPSSPSLNVAAAG
ncbi:MAG: sensor domain-containing diguanylate cyclase [Deltaproteobacteria bacterium]|nr:MAG: sensor domain-containing diguanylate cyclase [Deltaproteobacteria bacterium]